MNKSMSLKLSDLAIATAHAVWMVLVFCGFGMLLGFWSGLAQAEGSRSLYPANYLTQYPIGARADLDISDASGSYINQIRRRALLYVYAQAGEYITLGSRNRSGGGDINVYNPQSFGTPGNETLPVTPDFTCGGGSTQPGTHYSGGGTIASRTQELAGPNSPDNTVPVTNGFAPCAYQAPVTGIYSVLFTAATAGGTSAPDGVIDPPRLGATAASNNATVSAWDVTVRSNNKSTTNINGRLFTYAFLGFTGGNSTPAGCTTTGTCTNSRSVFSTLYYVTYDGYRYKQDLRGLDPNGFALYANTFGFLDNGQPLYKDIRSDDYFVRVVPPGVTTQPAQFPIFFSDVTPGGPNATEIDRVLGALGIPLTPPSPTLTAVSFTGNLGGSTTMLGVGGTFQFTTTDTITYQIVISRNGTNFDPANTANRVLTGIAGTGTHTVVWDGKDNSGSNFPAGGPYSFRVLGRNAEVHFPMVDAENNPFSGPTITRLNGTGAPDTTVYYDDRGYVTSGGTAVGILNGTLCGAATPAAPTNPVNLQGVDSLTNYRNWASGDNANTDCAATAGWGDTKALNLWTYYSTTPQSNTLTIQAVAVDVATAVSAPSTAAPGSTVQGAFSFANNGSSAAAGVTYSMTFPAGLGAGAITFGNLPSGVTATYNNTTGNVTFTGLPTSLPAGQSYTGMTYRYTAPASGTINVTTSITTTSSETYTANNSASASTVIRLPNVFSGTVFKDLNGNGSFDAGDVGQSGVTVTLYQDINGNGVIDAADTTVGTATTGAGGAYSFNNVGTGNFLAQITAGLPGGATYTTATVAGASFVTGGNTDADNNFGFTPAASALVVTKTASPAGDLTPGTTVTYTINVNNTSATTQTGIVVNDPLPTGLTYVTQSTVASGYVSTTISTTISDDFSSNNYSGGSGWGTNWTETDNGGATSPIYLTGNVLVSTTGCLTNTGSCLRMATDGNLNNGGTRDNSIQRSLNLSGYTSAALTCNFANTSGSSAVVAVDISNNGGSTWNTAIQSLSGNSGNCGSPSIDISPYISANTTVRFRITNSGGNSGSRYFYLDNVTVTAQGTSTTAATKDNIPSGANPDLSNGVPPSLVVAGDGFALANGQSMTVTYRATVNASNLPQNIVNLASVSSTQTAAVQASATNRVKTATISGTAWVDTNNNHTPDVGEPGLANVTIQLLDAANGNAVVATTTTGANGGYLFSGVLPGSYKVSYTTGVPTGLTLNTGTNPSSTITVAAGQSYPDNNFGFTNGATGVIGDLVWSDANGNGVRDPGEPGLGGVTLRLWQDTNNNGVYDPGADTQVATTTTAADGSYLFTNVAAGTYFVSSDVNSVLFGYSLTSPSSATVKVTLPAGGQLLGTDFGYRNTVTTYSITDNLWVDANSNGVKDSGETGVAGVTVNLLNSSGTVIATTVTDATGNISFTGVPNGTYTLAVTDTAGKLTNYTGTTSAAIAGQKTLTVNSGNVTGTSFGYNQKGAIGDRVFVDSNNNGVQDPGEPGIGGVTVRLYNSSNVQIATATTAADGSYLFTGQPAGTYSVKVDNTQTPALSGYTSLNTNSGNDSVISVTLTANSSVLSADFRYSAALPSVSGTVWSDTNRNGILETGEPGLSGVTVALLDNSGNVVATTTTVSSGAYAFSNVANGSYTVKVTDTRSVLRDYSSTTGGDTQSVTVSGAAVTGKNFGYYKPVPTYAPISKLLAYAVGNDVIVEWRTAVESGTLGFFLERLDPETGLFVALHDALLPGFGTSPRGGSYWFLDKTAQPQQRYTYRLIEVEMDNNRLEYGPFEVKVKDNGEQQIADWDATLRQTFWQNGFAQQRKEPSAQEVRDWNNKRDQRNAKHRAKPKKAFKEGDSQLRILVNAPGLYKLTVTEMADAFGVKANVIENYLRKGKLALSNGGQPVAYLVAKDNSALYFYGQGLDTVYTDTNVYWLGVGDALFMATRNTTPPQPDSVARTFPSTQRWTKNLSADVLKKFIPALFLTGEPDGDYWYWAGVVAGGAAFSSGGLDAPGAVSAGSAMVAVELRGGSESTTPVSTPDHHVEVSVNGVVVGSGRFNGTDRYRLEARFDQGIAGAPTILPQRNTVSLRGLRDGNWSSSFGVRSIELTYPRAYQAVGNALAFGTGDYPAVTVAGFTGSDVTVLDISDVRRPVTVAATVEAAPAGGYRVAVAAQSTQNAYLATTLSAAKSPKELVLDNVSTLKDTKNAADYLVIAPDSLQGGAEALVALRDSKQMKALYVDLQDIYNAFNYGVEDAHAIKDFLAYAHGHWKKAPTYVVLAGKGTVDPRDFWGFHTNVLPVLLVDSPYGMIASDNRYADVVGNDGVPEMAIGRIPALSDDELLAYVDKLRNAETAAVQPDAATWRNRAIMIADAPDSAGNFPVDSDSVIALLPSGMSVERDYYQKGQGDVYDQSFHDGLLRSISSGAGLVNYTGHGGIIQLGKTGFFTQANVAALTNGSKLPIMAALTCAVGWDFYPGGLDSLAHTLTLSPVGGVIAALVPSGLSNNDSAVELNKAFVTNVATLAVPVRIGDAVLDALYQYLATNPPRFMVDIYGVTGDPAAIIPFRTP